jgi:hypothetical protein
VSASFGLKAIGFPTDAKLLHAAIRCLNRLVKEHAVRLRQSYLRVAKRVAMMVGLAAVGGRPYQYFSRQRLRL